MKAVATACALLGAGVLAGCTPERAQLEVELLPPVLSRFIVHGNCFAGWYMTLVLVVHERRGAAVVLDAVSLHVEDERAGAVLGDRMLDAAALQVPERFGPGGAAVPARGSLLIEMGVGALPGSVEAPQTSGAVVVSGDVQGHDDHGRVRASYRVPAMVTVDGRPIPASGACSPRP